MALRADPDQALTEDTYLDLMADIQWTPSVRYLQPEEAGINRFAFVIHPLNVGFIQRSPMFRWTKYLPDRSGGIRCGLHAADVRLAHHRAENHPPQASGSKGISSRWAPLRAR